MLYNVDVLDVGDGSYSFFLAGLPNVEIDRFATFCDLWACSLIASITVWGLLRG